MIHQEGERGLHFPYLTAEPSFTPLASVLRKLLWERALWSKDFRHQSQAFVFKLVLPGISFVALGKSYNLSEYPVSSCIGIKWHLPHGALVLSQNETKYKMPGTEPPLPPGFSDSEVILIQCPLRSGRKSVHLTENYFSRWGTGFFSDLTHCFRAWHVSRSHPLKSEYFLPRAAHQAVSACHQSQQTTVTKWMRREQWDRTGHRKQTGRTEARPETASTTVLSQTRLHLSGGTWMGASEVISLSLTDSIKKIKDNHAYLTKPYWGIKRDNV